MAFVALKWELEYDPEHGQLLSLFNLTPENQGSVIIRTVAALMEGEAVPASGLASELSNITAGVDGSYTGWV